MKRNILFVKNAHFSNTKLRKYARVFTENGYELSFLGWKRKEEEPETSDKYKEVMFLHRGGGYGTNAVKLAGYYLVWMVKLFFFALKKNNIQKYNNILLTDFDVALPFYLATFFKKDIQYLYEIRDDFALRYRFPEVIKKMVTNLDYKIKARALKVIHVDESRIRENDTNYIVIKNSPFDFYNKYQVPNYKNKLAIIGHLSEIRGLNQIIQFAIDYPEFEFVFAGVEIFHGSIKETLKNLNNVTIYKRMEQEKLFEIIKDCSGIFSIYDPSLEINRKAASNKLYDAMMLGIPVIVNNEILAAQFVTQNKLGFLIDYEYNDSWKNLADNLKDKEKVQRLGRNGRKVYENNLDFESIVVKNLFPIINI